VDPGIDSDTIDEDWDGSNDPDDTLYEYSTEVRTLFDVPTAVLIYYR
jgi:hypothetical protein